MQFSKCQTRKKKLIKLVIAVKLLPIKFNSEKFSVEVLQKLLVLVLVLEGLLHTRYSTFILMLATDDITVQNARHVQEHLSLGSFKSSWFPSPNIRP